MRQFFVWPLLTLAAAGCGSIRTTPLDRTEADTYVVNPHHPICGVPVMLRVPTHLSVTVLERRYWKVDDSGELKSLQAKRPVIDVEHNLEYTEKMFVVDPVKPLSGDQAYGFAFAANDDTHLDRSGKGYMSGMSYKSVDTSIVDTAALIGTALRRFGGGRFAGSGANGATGDSPANVIYTTRVIAFHRFDINSANFEDEVSAFLSCHLNDRCFHNYCDVTAYSCESDTVKQCEDAPQMQSKPCPPETPKAAPKKP